MAGYSLEQCKAPPCGIRPRPSAEPLTQFLGDRPDPVSAKMPEPSRPQARAASPAGTKAAILRNRTGNLLSEMVEYQNRSPVCRIPALRRGADRILRRTEGNTMHEASEKSRPTSAGCHSPAIEHGLPIIGDAPRCMPACAGAHSRLRGIIGTQPWPGQSQSKIHSPQTQAAGRVEQRKMALMFIWSCRVIEMVPHECPVDLGFSKSRRGDGMDLI